MRRRIAVAGRCEVGRLLRIRLQKTANHSHFREAEPGNESGSTPDRKSTRLNSSHANISTLSLHDALPILTYSFPGSAWERSSRGSCIAESLAISDAPANCCSRPLRGRPASQNPATEDSEPQPLSRGGAWERVGFYSRSEEHTSELQSRQYLHSFPTRRSSDLNLLVPRLRLGTQFARLLHRGIAGDK